MDTETILTLMQAGRREATTWTVLPVLYALALADISDKLGDEELHRMIAIGGAINDCVNNEIRASVLANARLQQAMTGQAPPPFPRDKSQHTSYAWKRLSIACNRAILFPEQKLQASKWATQWARAAGFLPR